MIWQDLLIVLKQNVGPGRITTYGDLSRWAFGHRLGAPSIVSMLEKMGDEGHREWAMRVVRDDGGIAGKPDTEYGQREQLLKEGVPFTEKGFVDFDRITPAMLEKRDTTEATELLARVIYAVIRKVAQKPGSDITYGDLCSWINDSFPNCTPRSPALMDALTLIQARTRNAGLPGLASIVVQAETRRPGEGFFKTACSHLKAKQNRLVAWKREFEAVHTSRYPTTFSKRRSTWAEKLARQ